MKRSRFPLTILLVFVIAHTMSAMEIIPSLDSVSLYLNDAFKKYGLVAVSCFSFIENIVGVNAYFPGSVVILTAMSMTGGNIAMGLKTYFSIMLSAFVAYNVNYGIGRFFTYKNVSSKTDRAITHALFMSTFWHPHFAALTCLAAGANGIGYFAFFRLFIISGLFWNSFWGLLMYNVGWLTSANLDLMPLMYVYLMGWAALSAYRDLQSFRGADQAVAGEQKATSTKAVPPEIG